MSGKPLSNNILLKRKELAKITALDYLKNNNRFPNQLEISEKNGFPFGMRASTILKHFGNLQNFEIFCGYYRSDIKTKLRETVVAEAINHFNTFGKFPIGEKFNNSNGFSAHKDTVCSLFGSWIDFRNHCAIVQPGINTKKYIRKKISSNKEMKSWLLTMINKDENGCWNWTGLTHYGYGTTMFNGKHMGVHRLSYMLWVGNIDKNKLIRHRCNNRVCCNPKHLIPGTYSENQKDRAKIGKAGNYKCTKQLVKRPRGLYGTNFIDWVMTVVNRDSNGCMLYPKIDSCGYANSQINGKTMRIHRYIYCIINNENYNDRSFLVRHLCNNSGCVNPKHLLKGSQSDNTKDSRSYHRGYKLTKKKSEEIRSSWYTTNLTKTEFDILWSKKLNVSSGTIRNARLKKSWV